MKIINKIKKVHEKVDYEEKLIITDKYIHNISELEIYWKKTKMINNVINILKINLRKSYQV